MNQEKCKRNSRNCAACLLLQEAHVRHQKDMDALQFRLTKLQQEFEAQLNVCDQLNTENQNRALELKVRTHVPGRVADTR